MKLRRRASALIVAVAVMGLIAGSVISASAAPSGDSTAAAGSGFGPRLGSAMRDAGGRLVDVVAKLTGQDAAEVREQRAAGKSFADIAETKGVTSAEVVESAMEIRGRILADRVEAGVITQGQAEAALERMQARLSERVTSTDARCNGGGMGGGRGGGMGGGRRGGMGGGVCGGACAPSPATTQ